MAQDINEDEELRKVMELSLITEKEDAVRRENRILLSESKFDRNFTDEFDFTDKYGSFDIQRQQGNILPKPELPPRKSLSNNRVKSMPHYLPLKEKQDNDICLITLSPTISAVSLADFDLVSFDPLNSSPPTPTTTTTTGYRRPRRPVSLETSSKFLFDSDPFAPIPNSDKTMKSLSVYNTNQRSDIDLFGSISDWSSQHSDFSPPITHAPSIPITAGVIAEKETLPSANREIIPLSTNEEQRDLITFRHASHDFLSLESFDPLFSSEIETKDDTNDSFYLMKTPEKKVIERSLTPINPFPELSSGVSVHSSSLSDSFSSTLQDPFCVNDLTAALEHKRRKHEKEAKEREENKTKEPILREHKHKNGDSNKRQSSYKRDRTLYVRQSSYLCKEQEVTYESLQESEVADAEISAFCQMVARVKNHYGYEIDENNTGIVMCQKHTGRSLQEMSVKIRMIYAPFPEPVMFTSTVTANVSHIIGNVLFSINEGRNECVDSYVLKVHGLCEYLSNDSLLGDYSYVQECMKLNVTIRLVLIKVSDIHRVFLRTSEDDKHLVYISKGEQNMSFDTRVSKDKLNILMETFYNEVERVRDASLQGDAIQTKGVIQAVKALCFVLYKIETLNVIESVRNLQNHHSSNVDKLHSILEELTRSVKSQISLYCSTTHADFRFDSTSNIIRERQSILSIYETVLIHVSTVHRIPPPYMRKYENFIVRCCAYHGSNLIGRYQSTLTLPHFDAHIQDTLVFNEWLQFSKLNISDLPRETRLCFELIGICPPAPVEGAIKNTEIISTVREEVVLGVVALQCFNHKGLLLQGSQLLAFWPANNQTTDPFSTNEANLYSPDSIFIQINLPEFEKDIYFPDIVANASLPKQDFRTLPPSEQSKIKKILSRDSITCLTHEEKLLIWTKRYYLRSVCSSSPALCRILESAPSFSARSLPEIYALLSDWSDAYSSPLHALRLLLPNYPDTKVRQFALNEIKNLPSDELIDFLPQIVQAVKFESYHTATLCEFLLEKSLCSVRLAHRLYWIIKEAADDIYYRKRYELLCGALLSVMGTSLRRQLSREERLVSMLSKVAEKVKAGKDKEVVLHSELNKIHNEIFITSDKQVPLQLPINPSMAVSTFDKKSCSFFASNAFPLKLVFKNYDDTAESIYAMFKAGDDLRQDMLTMQLLRVMDRLWLRNDLDLRIVTFSCQPTADCCGLVELVTDAETLRRIQTSKQGHGVAGSFRDKSIAEWLQIQNSTELDYKKSVENFTLSCAGYCVATYLLGICDRHNDNIMLKRSGHLFHIDFGKFLGDSQMFGTFKRDRVPFVLTSDMAYVINNGEKPTKEFQVFVDTCCEALNILRKNSDLLLNLFSLMVNSNIPGVNKHAVTYVQKALMTSRTDREVTCEFTRLIDESLQSKFTQLNFFIHNVAQMKFSAHAEGALLSFIPKTYSLNIDGKIKKVEIFGYQKRYNTEKYYVYIMKVDRHNVTVPSFVLRRFSEIQEFYSKLCSSFPLAKLSSLTSGGFLTRKQVRSVAAQRKEAVEIFIKELFSLAPEISEHDLVYTFFHPMLRDEQEIDQVNLNKIREPQPAYDIQASNVPASIKLSLFWEYGQFNVMVMHVKDLNCSVVPNPYVKLYLLPDIGKVSKRKTKIAYSSCFPTFNEVLNYKLPLEELMNRHLQVSVWNHDNLQENQCLGILLINLQDTGVLMENGETTGWYQLSEKNQTSNVLRV